MDSSAKENVYEVGEPADGSCGRCYSGSVQGFLHWRESDYSPPSLVQGAYCRVRIGYDGLCFSRVTKNPKFAFQASQNLKPCFDYLINKRGLKLVNIGPQDIFNGVHKLTLALIFQIIIAVQIDNIEVDGLKGQHGLLLWVNRQIEPYGQHVTDFKESWRNGLAFAALAAALCDGYNFPAAEGMDQNTRHASA